MRRRSSSKLPIILIGLVVVVGGFFLVRLISGFGANDPEDVVKAFYEYEQEGDFGSAWELFHPSMQARFTKNSYVTERSHIYMSHYGVTTFSYDVDGEEEVENFKMAKDAETFPTAFKMTVSQTFKSKFGTFTVKQDVYAVLHEEVWKVVWEYK
ncbi:hypothetical protein [Metabacillus sp. B2-18]|uniref:hypothetical protein n=1 Tax=Metabacillus sp. B2-18 TaxID=2897333 RepID=UPI001E2B339F|nr:hypothetical protein [Metabacillus sp. B2-18]UGB30602.1 hypothetical protein LPC09_23380 [Metabacillus sp. B2-18]